MRGTENLALQTAYIHISEKQFGFTYRKIPGRSLLRDSLEVFYSVQNCKTVIFGLHFTTATMPL
jgi:hypothetical protein